MTVDWPGDDGGPIKSIRTLTNLLSAPALRRMRSHRRDALDPLR